MTNFLQKIKQQAFFPLVCRGVFVILDILIINLSSYMALWLRFNMKTAEMDVRFLASVTDMIPLNTVVTVGIFAVVRLYTSLWRFASMKELIYILEGCVCSMLFNVFYYFFTRKDICRSYFPLYITILFLFVCASRFSYRFLRLIYRGRLHGGYTRNTMIIGAGEACNVVMKELEMSMELDSRICCIIDDDSGKRGKYIHGVKVVGDRNQILKYAQKYAVNEIIIAIPSVSRQEQMKILSICKEVPN